MWLLMKFHFPEKGGRILFDQWVRTKLADSY